MAAVRIRPRNSGFAGFIQYGLTTSRSFQSSVRSLNSETVDLSYDLHVQGSCKTDPGSCNSPIVFLHGLFGSKANNRTVSKRLALDLNRPVYALDLRNHGSSPHLFPHTYLTLAADVDRFIKKHKLERPTIIGHSMGAKTAMTLALQHPEYVENLVAVDNAPVDAALKSDFHTYVRGMKEVERLKPKKQSEADKILKPYAEQLPVRQFLLTNLIRSKDNPDELVWRVPLADLAKGLDHMGDFPFHDPMKARFEKPTLLVRGTRSPYVPDEVLPAFGEFFPKFQVVDIDSGHWVTSEKPEEFRKAVVEFLEDKN